MLATLHSFGEWLAGTPLSMTIQDVSWIIPTVQTVHIVCVALVISSVFLVDLRLLGVFARKQPVAALTARFLTGIWFVLPILLVTGSILIIGEPGRSLENPAFGLKMLMLLMVIVITLVIQRPMRTNAGYWDSGGRRVAARTIALFSLALWSGIVFAGRWIAYVASY